jgi:hypothetical protein
VLIVSASALGFASSAGSAEATRIAEGADAKAAGARNSHETAVEATGDGSQALAFQIGTRLRRSSAALVGFTGDFLLSLCTMVHSQARTLVRRYCGILQLLCAITHREQKSTLWL